VSYIPADVVALIRLRYTVAAMLLMAAAPKGRSSSSAGMLSPRSPKSTANPAAQAFPESRSVMAHAVFHSLLTCALLVGARCSADVRLVDAAGASSNAVGLVQVRMFSVHGMSAVIECAVSAEVRAASECVRECGQTNAN
jgi:hypothetical protein